MKAKTKKQENSDEGDALRYDADKLRFDLIPMEAEIEIARIYSMGGIKYDDNNWRKGMNWSKCYGSLRRHLAKFWAGERIDSETGCHHMAQVAWNAITLLVYDLNKSGKDDRIKLDIDENFNWKNHPDIGLDPEAMAEFIKKYGKAK